MKYFINSIQDIENLRTNYKLSLFNEIIIEKSKIKNQGVFRWALKYAIWNICVNGKIIIKDSSYADYNKRKKNLDFWQTKREIYKTIDQEVEVELLSEEKIVLKRIESDNYINDGISFGVVFSGATTEEDMLRNCLDSIKKNCEKYSNISVEIVICGPSDYQFDLLREEYKSINLQYLCFDKVIDNGRFMIGNKKNYLYNFCNYNVVALMHTRIIIEEDFINKIFYRKFDMVAPRVLVEDNAVTYDYLSYHLIKSYEFSLINSLIITSSYLQSSYLFYVKNHVPYIDGGITIFNKKILKDNPFNVKIAWSEAEDIELAQKQWTDGLLIDYFEDIVCHSQTVKYKLKPSNLKKMFLLWLKLQSFFKV